MIDSSEIITQKVESQRDFKLQYGINICYEFYMVNEMAVYLHVRRIFTEAIMLRAVINLYPLKHIWKRYPKHKVLLSIDNADRITWEVSGFGPHNLEVSQIVNAVLTDFI